MTTNNFDILNEFIFEFQQEYDDIQKKIEKNQFKHREMKQFLESLLDSEDKDFKVFSPRNNEVIHKDKIKKINEILSSYEKENVELNSISASLQKRINNIKVILETQEDYRLKLFNIQEDERCRISRELHDTSLQNLTHLVHKIELSSMYIDEDPIRAKLELSVISKNLKSVIEEIRNTIFNLRPMEFDDLGLKASFERLISIINSNREYDIDFYIEDVSCENNFILLTLYRTVQECLMNIKKHAEATKIIFHGKCIDGNYIINIEDNGKGFNWEDVKEKKCDHFGLSLVKERVHVLKGIINITSNDKGVKIEIKIPIQDDLVIR